MGRHSTGDLIAVFDADHGPVKTFLRETVGHFADDRRLFLVQTPHFFLEPRPDREEPLDVPAHALRERDVLLDDPEGPGQVERRLLLRLGGGAARTALARPRFSGISITEDCETALELHSRGWNSRYVDIPLIAGLQPENFVSFIGQRSRWCSGMVQILMLKNPLFKKGLRPEQRIAYLSSSLFWMFRCRGSPSRSRRSSTSSFAADLRGELPGVRRLHDRLHGGEHHAAELPLRAPAGRVSELYEYVQSVFLFRSIISVVMSPRKPTFNVTAKGRRSTRSTSRRWRAVFRYLRRARGGGRLCRLALPERARRQRPAPHRRRVEPAQHHHRRRGARGRLGKPERRRAQRLSILRAACWRSSAAARCR